MLQIIEILRPADQGRTTPFLCRAEDDRLYYVKGLNTGRHGQWCEWISAYLANALGLPIPHFDVVDVPAELLAIAKPEWQVMGSGPAFASLAQECRQWLEPAFVNHVPVKQRCDVLVFDWWVQNMDRFNDNTNLLWEGVNKALTVIDHNMAFNNSDFWPSMFRQQHVFADDWPLVFDDLVQQAEYASRLAQALPVVDLACHNAPAAWHWETNEMLRPFTFDLDAAKAIVNRCLTNDFWRMV